MSIPYAFLLLQKTVSSSLQASIAGLNAEIVSDISLQQTQSQCRSNAGNTIAGSIGFPKAA